MTAAPPSLPQHPGARAAALCPLSVWLTLGNLRFVPAASRAVVLRVAGRGGKRYTLTRSPPKQKKGKQELVFDLRHERVLPFHLLLLHYRRAVERFGLQSRRTRLKPPSGNCSTLNLVNTVDDCSSAPPPCGMGTLMTFPAYAFTPKRGRSVRHCLRRSSQPRKLMSTGLLLRKKVKSTTSATMSSTARPSVGAVWMITQSLWSAPRLRAVSQPSNIPAGGSSLMHASAGPATTPHKPHHARTHAPARTHVNWGWSNNKTCTGGTQTQSLQRRAKALVGSSADRCADTTTEHIHKSRFFGRVGNCPGR